MSRLPQPKHPCLQAAPVRLGVRLRPEAHALLCRVDRGPEVLPPPALAYQPRLVEDRDPPLPINLAQDVEGSRRQGQAARGQPGGQVPGPAQGHEAPPPLGRRPAAPGGRLILRALPAPEERLLGLHLGQAGELVTRPEGRDPKAVEGLDLVMALGLVARDEERLDLAEQAQAHHLAEDPRAGRPPPAAALVLDLLQERPAQLGPGPEQVGPARAPLLSACSVRQTAWRARSRGGKFWITPPPRRCWVLLSVACMALISPGPARGRRPRRGPPRPGGSAPRGRAPAGWWRRWAAAGGAAVAAGPGSPPRPSGRSGSRGWRRPPGRAGWSRSLAGPPREAAGRSGAEPGNGRRSRCRGDAGTRATPGVAIADGGRDPGR